MQKCVATILKCVVMVPAVVISTVRTEKKALPKARSFGFAATVGLLAAGDAAGSGAAAGPTATARPCIPARPRGSITVLDETVASDWAAAIEVQKSKDGQIRSLQDAARQGQAQPDAEDSDR
uniref:ESPR domain-containing protein n=1 Tax=Steinernema glaseri TaxID=37863 RepID=A0A1I7Z4K0_9BILA